MIHRFLFEMALARRCVRVCDVFPATSTTCRYSATFMAMRSESKDEIFSHGSSLLRSDHLDRFHDQRISCSTEYDDADATDKDDTFRTLVEECYKHGGQMLQVLKLAEAVCEREGIDGVRKFIVNYRNKFLVRKHPGNSPPYRAAERRLFAAAFRSLGEMEWKNLEPCRQVSQLCDFLADELLVGSRESFVDAGVDYFLQKSMFAEAFCFWRTQLRVYHTRFGMQPLLNYVIARHAEHEGVCKDRIVEIMRESELVVKPTEYLAILVTAMLTNGHFEDAKAFTKLFSIPGLHFIYSVRKLADEERVELLEKFGQLLSDVYFTELRTKRVVKLKPTAASKPVMANASSEEDGTERLAVDLTVFAGGDNVESQMDSVTVSSACEFRFLLNIWKQSSGGKKLKKFMKKQSKPRNHKVDIRQLEDLTHLFIQMWVGAAGINNDCESLLRLHLFTTSNQLHVWPGVASRCRAAFRRNGRLDVCPFEEPLVKSVKRQHRNLKRPTNQLKTNA